MTLYDFAISPFADYGFMRRALIATVALGIAAGPVGVLLLLRRMSLVADAMSHAVLPGAALGFLCAGSLSLPAMGLGGLIAGLGVAALSGVVTRSTGLKEDASFGTFYLTSLALGVLIVSLKGSNIDVLHVLFGSILAIDKDALFLVAAITSATLLILAIVYRPLVIECFDPGFLRRVGGHGAWYHFLFLILVVINLVSGFQTLGTLMTVGMMILPAAIARLWSNSLIAMIGIAAFTAALSGFIGLLASFHLGFASGPTILLTASTIYFVSLFLCPGSRFRRLFTVRRLSV